VGIPHRGNNGSTDYKVAEQLLDLRLAELKTNSFTPRWNVCVDELIDDLLAEYEEKQQKSIEHVKAHWELHLKPFFTHRNLRHLDRDDSQVCKKTPRRRGERSDL
jgi:hypothetical protein